MTLRLISGYLTAGGAEDTEGEFEKRQLGELCIVIHFKGELAKVHLEHRQVIHRPLNDFLQSPVPGLGFAGTLFATEDGFESRHVQHSARAVNEPLIDGVQLPLIRS